MNDVVALTSGGIRSAVAALSSGRDRRIILVHVDYGQPSAKKERSAVRGLVEALPHARGVAVELPYVGGLQGHGELEESTLTSHATPAGAVGVPSAAVGLRGLFPVLLSIGCHYASRYGAQLITTGLSQSAGVLSPLLAHVEGQPGKLREFVQTFNMMIETTLPEKVHLKVDCPLIEVNYAETVCLAERLHLPLEHSWSCETGKATPCMACEGCKSRYSAFADARLPDPLAGGVRSAT